MRTTIKTLASLFATVVLTSCTDQSIEPIRPATQSQSATVCPDTANQIFMKGYNRSDKTLHGKMIISNELNQNPLQPETAIEPTPHTAPVVTPGHKPRLDIMPVKQPNDLL